MKHIFAFILLSFSFVFIAQQGDGGKPKGNKLADVKTLNTILFQEPNISVLRAEDEINDKLGNRPWRFGFNNTTNLNTENTGLWKTLPNGDQIWFLAVECTNALSVNLTFSETNIPEGNELYVYNPKKDFILGR